MGPNPRFVRIVMAEKGIDLDLVQVDLIAGENREAAHVARNPSGTLPTLELDDGTFISEITVIAEYLEEKNPATPLVGTTAEERAEARMWTRRIDLGIVEPLTGGFRYAEGLTLFQNRMRCIPEAADGLKAIAQDRLELLNGLIGDREFICGDRFTIADILLFAFLEFAGGVGQPLDAKFENLQAWFTRVAARPSIEASK